MNTPQARFLPGVPGTDIERIYKNAPGNEIDSGKFDSLESSAALAANAFGFFLRWPQKLPPLPDCRNAGWPALSLALEETVRFPWKGGCHPVLDCLLVTSKALIGIESKRFEPFRLNRSRSAPSLSDAYWRPVWGSRMEGFQKIRNDLSDKRNLYRHLDAAQLFKHAFALRTAVHRNNAFKGLTPVLYYLYAEPKIWPKDGTPVDDEAIFRHRREIVRFSDVVAGDEVTFVACDYRRVLDAWRSDADDRIHAHVDAVTARYSP